MALHNLDSAATTSFNSNIPNYSVLPIRPDSAGNQKETYWDNDKFTQWFGYYKKIPELKKAMDALATWVLGKGYDTEPETEVILDNIKGWGEDTFKSVLWNMIVTKKVGGDAFAEIMRDPDTGTLINLKPLDPGIVRIVADRKGRIIRYELRSKTSKDALPEKFEPKEILHLCNDRIADEIHGTSVVEACEEVILARNESIADWKKVLRRNVNPLKIWYTDIDDPTKIATLITKIETTTKDKENIVIPASTVPKVDVITAPLVAPLDWIKYLENFFYQAVGIPKIILGGSEEFTEASSKIAYLTFEQVYAKEQEELEADIWNQLQLRIKFRKPASLMNELLSSDAKNTSQTGFQPNDVQAGNGQ